MISDVHGNLHALEAVLAAVAREAPDEVWCLGDLTGYGPRPNGCCSRVRELAAVSLVGNHDLGVLGHLDLNDFSPDAAESARWTSSVLASRERAWLASLAPRGESHGVGLYHASPRDPIWEYVLSADVAAESLLAATEPLILVGHSHVPLAFGGADGALSGWLAPDGTEVDLASGERWLLNPGSVGQPRDGDPRAAYAVLDLGAGRAAFRRVPYPVEQTQEEIADAGLPPALAARLEHGL
ncbi:MAG: metallophosphoesterase family protein [Thermoleophilia bacterium]|nr:metallophosphoesterase family protein [Thermoleophilia bacterium]